MLALKFLTADGKGPTSKFEWPLPRKTKAGRWLPGRWVRVAGDLELCKVGVHACLPKDAKRWWNDRLFVVELEDPITDGGDKLVAHRGRLLREIEQWRYPLPKALARVHIDEVRAGCSHPADIGWRQAFSWMVEFEIRPRVTPMGTSAICALVAERLPPPLDLEAILREAAA